MAISVSSDRPLIPNLLQGRFRDEVRLEVVLLGAALTLAIFVVDLMLPLGIAGGIPYIAPVFLAIWLPDRRLIVAVAAVCTVLTVTGTWLSPPGSDLTTVLANRLLAIGAIWTVALLAYQRKRFESALASSEAANRAVLAHTADGILAVDHQGSITSANPAAERTFGRPRRRLLGRSFGELLAPVHRTVFESDPRAFLAGIDERRSAVRELTVLRLDGSAVPIEAVFAPLHEEDGVRYIVTVRDISERRLLEQYLLRANDEERRAFGVSLHEELGQSLTGLSLITRQLARRLAGNDVAAARDLSELSEMLQSVDAQALKLFESVAPLAANGHLSDALSHLVADAAERHDVAWSLDDRGMVPPADEFAAAQVYFIINDLLKNLLIDSKVSCVVLQLGLEGSDPALRLRLLSEGPAVEIEAELLRKLTYRATLIDVRLDITQSGEDELSIRFSWAPASGHAHTPSGRRRAIAHA